MISLNGKAREGTGMSLEELLLAENFNAARVAVGLNGQVLRKEDFGSFVLKDGDEVEVFHFMGGG